MADNKVITFENELFDLWKRCFDDDNGVISSFFDCVYDASRCIYEKRDGKTVSALYLLPCEYRRRKCFYLYAAATLPEYRRQGIIAELVSRACEQAKRSGASFIYLFPAEEKLYPYYEKLGFSQELTAAVAEMKTDELPRTGEVHLCSLREFYDLLRKNARYFHAPVPERRVLPYIGEITDNALFSYCVKDGRVSALAACEIKDGKAVSIYADASEGCYNELLSSFRVFGADSCSITFPACLEVQAQTVKNGMLKPISTAVTGQADIYTGFNML